MVSQITALPTPPSRQDPENFASRADAWVQALAQFVADANLLASDVEKLVSTFGLSTTSTTEHTIDTAGAKDFIVGANLAFSIGQYVTAANASDPTKYLVGQVTAYDSETGSLTLAPYKAVGSGTFNSWVIALTLTSGEAEFVTSEADRAGVGATIASSLGEIYSSIAAALSNGVHDLDSLVPGSGGTDGTYDLSFSGGSGTGAAGWFTVNGGAVTLYKITARGENFTSAPAVSFAAAPGLTGASANAVIAANREVGQHFSIIGPDVDRYVDTYRVDVGPIATLVSSLSASQIVTAIKKMVSSAAVEGGSLLDIADDYGFSAFYIDLLGGLFAKGYNLEVLEGSENVTVADRFGFVPAEYDIEKGLSAFKLSLRNVEFLETTAYDFIITDPNGFVIFDPIDAPQEQEQAAETIESRNAVNLALSALPANRINPILQRAVAAYNHFITYGQSLSTGFEGWPALTKAAYAMLGNLMLGGSVRSDDRFSTTFDPVTDGNLNPMISVVQSTNGSVILDDATVAVLAPGSGNEGESIDVGALNMARALFLAHHGLAQDSSRKFVTTNCGVGGRTVAELSKGATPEYYNRILDAAAKVKAIADGESATYAIPAMLFLQGEADFSEGTDKATYKTELKQLYDDFVIDVCVGIAGQTNPPAMLTYQTSGSYIRDTFNVSQAQLELSEENPNWFLVAPSYPYTDKGGHLDPNGYRWLGMQFGKVLHRVVTLGQDWKPLSPRKATYDGSEVLIDFNVPEPPLVLDEVAVENTLKMFQNRGFSVLVEGIYQSIGGVEIVNDSVVKISLVNAIPANSEVKVTYANKTDFGGNGNLRDSDPTIAIENYEYSEGTGQYASANLAEFVGKPYPLHNWCVAFTLRADNEV